jgi:hypothetical protein
MSKNYYDMTGVLVLDKVTPVIEAFFSPLKLDPTFPGHGEAYICMQTKKYLPMWDDVLKNLRGLATHLGLALPAETDDDLVGYLTLLASHFGTSLDDCFLNIEDFIYGVDVEVEELFSLALLFNDGHGLKAVKTDAAWTSSKPGLFEFGGVGEFIGQHYKAQTVSMAVIEYGPRLDEALATHDLTKATEILQDVIEHFLYGIQDASAQDIVRRMLGGSLSAAPSLDLSE